ncbi:uncharacterized protein LOC130636211 isoform X2 [Hydractinia symbiolongicarpus]|nr:uncharacterized protein LOC130636211 isoform X2 [Hydractinia symbiolongicarpus]XP_057301841.1 uncharacterized protein LOC130636211 isoform X2 [Hydractinia symbiolongicarpus]XP_057301842.1 uncharacterized protein LOC130636211 isoform X2 [Hydractinia symbiolongicarpus]XP_057301843.1 uncharacterized protein LOC130636211 isoform X2 [Hydractinia symbiolongicarpus]XP_057301844.1 uncharacterized protein LOC130636211 isoform X2 [Hydractinia symbiolongicarpus]XP_057301845.1 uncharacterized protein L
MNLLIPNEGNMLNIAILFLSCYINYVSSLSLTSPAIIEEVVNRSVTITYVTDAADNVIFIFEIYYNDSLIASGTKSVLAETSSKPFGNRLRASLSLQNQKNYSLHIDNLKYNDTGLFFAKINFFDLKLKMNSTTKLIIYGGPSIISNLSSTYTVEENTTNYKVPIILQGHPKPQVTWEFAGNKNVRVETIDEKKRKYKYILTIPMITREMNGKVLSYKAVGYNDNEVVGSTKLNVTYSPTFCDTAVIEVIEFAEVASAVFTTHVCGNPMPTVSMDFGGQSVATVLLAEKEKYKYTVNLTPYLIPNRCGKKLIVTAKNNKGERISRIVLKYKLTPERVKNVNSIEKDGCIYTKWEKVNTGECAVLYRIDYFDSKGLVLFSQNMSEGIYTASMCDEIIISKVNNLRIIAISHSIFKVQGNGTIVKIDKPTDNDSADIEIIIGIIAAVLISILLVVLVLIKRKHCGCRKQETFSGENSGQADPNDTYYNVANLNAEYSELNIINVQHDLYTGLTKTPEESHYEDLKKKDITENIYTDLNNDT